jgi:hypothetical protein
MLSLPFCPDAGACRVLLPRARSVTGAAFPAKAREASRGRHKTPSNGLKKLENLPLTPIFASQAFFRTDVWVAPQGVVSLDLRLSRMLREVFAKNPASD